MLQGYDLTIKHRSGKSNLVADDLSRVVTQPESVDAVNQSDIGVQDMSGQATGIEGTVDLPKLQREDMSLLPMIEYLETQILLAGEKAAKDLIYSAQYYTIMDRILYRVEPKGHNLTLLVVPESLKQEVIQ